MLQPQVVNVRTSVYGPQINIVCLDENRIFDPVHTAEIRRASIHAVKITIWYTRADNVRYLNGQYIA